MYLQPPIFNSSAKSNRIIFFDGEEVVRLHQCKKKYRPTLVQTEVSLDYSQTYDVLCDRHPSNLKL